jgi:peptidyl-tRNA hydrolase, PTH1 family
LSAERWIVAGLGNPGPEYAGNRHNAGHMVVGLLAGRAGARVKAHRSGCDIAEIRLGDVPVTLALPRSYMNLSGRPVASLAAFYKIPPERIVVIHDELDIAFGALRLKLGGGDNGHNGLRSITQALGTPDYYRVRFGIGRPPGRMDAAAYVLRDFSPPERKDLPYLIDRAADATETLILQGLPPAQNQYHPVLSPPNLAPQSHVPHTSHETRTSHEPRTGGACRQLRRNFGAKRNFGDGNRRLFFRAAPIFRANSAAGGDPRNRGAGFLPDCRSATWRWNQLGPLCATHW